MNTLTIHFHEQKTSYAPGDRIQGIAEWSLMEDGGAAEVHLLWYTKGKGGRAVEMIKRETAEYSGRSGKYAFDWQLPRSPYSYEGTLFSIIWEVELVIDGMTDTGNTMFTMRPRREPGESNIKGAPGWMPDDFSRKSGTGKKE